MLTKRTSILFDEELWRLLVARSKTEGSSVGDLVRRAVRTLCGKEGVVKKRAAVLRKIRRIRPCPFRGKTDYKELISYGRKC